MKIREIKELVNNKTGVLKSEEKPHLYRKVFG